MRAKPRGIQARGRAFGQRAMAGAPPHGSTSRGIARMARSYKADALCLTEAEPRRGREAFARK